jgi:hypothetical protein
MAFTPVVARDGNNAAQSMSALQDLAGVNYPQVGLDSTQQTYRASASFTPFATAALGLVTIIGSASKTVRVKRILIGGVATALADTLFRLTRVSVIGTGGTAVAPTIAKNDSGSAAATAVVQHYTTAAQSTGTVGSVLSHWRQFIATVTTPATAYTNPTYQVFPECGVGGQSLVLRGVADMLQIENLNAGNLGAGTVLEYVVEWVEDAS